MMNLGHIEQLSNPDELTESELIKNFLIPKPINIKERGYVLYDGKSLINGEYIVVIATMKSGNDKTGPMVQTWILNKNMSPRQAVNTGHDKSVCGMCRHKPSENKTCYVQVDEAPTNVWESYQKGNYFKLSMRYPKEFADKFSDTFIRFGAYGDPAAAPFYVWNDLYKYASDHTGYTHQWREGYAQELKPLCMASVDRPLEQMKAEQMGWRTFRVIKRNDKLLPGEIICPNTTKEILCIKCLLCKGTSTKSSKPTRTKNIAIEVHGSNKNKFNPYENNNY